MQVKVAALPGASKNIDLAGDNPTLQEALNEFFGGAARTQGLGEVRVNNQPVKQDYGDVVLQSNAIVTIVGRVNGG